MSLNSTRVLIVDADPEGGGTLATRLAEIADVHVVGVVHNRNAAKAETETLKPDILLVDLMLPGYRSIDIVRHVADTQPEIHILALAPADPPHDRIMLAVEAGALGYIARDATLDEFAAAIEQVHQGEPWLPLHQTYEVLQEGAGELAVSSEERRDRLTQVVLGLVPLTGLIAAITAFLWRQYWGGIGVRVADLGVDPTTRMIDVVIVFLVVLGTFGPVMFVRSWQDAIGAWTEEQPRFAGLVGKAQALHLGKLPVGRILFNRFPVCGRPSSSIVSTVLVHGLPSPLTKKDVGCIIMSSLELHGSQLSSYGFQKLEPVLDMGQLFLAKTPAERSSGEWISS